MRPVSVIFPLSLKYFFYFCKFKFYKSYSCFYFCCSRVNMYSSEILLLYSILQYNRYNMNL